MFFNKGETAIVLDIWSNILSILSALAPQFALGGLVMNDDQSDHWFKCHGVKVKRDVEIFPC